jgi:hypothetical protein
MYISIHSVRALVLMHPNLTSFASRTTKSSSVRAHLECTQTFRHYVCAHFLILDDKASELGVPTHGSRSRSLVEALVDILGREREFAVAPVQGGQGFCWLHVGSIGVSGLPHWLVVVGGDFGVEVWSWECRVLFGVFESSLEFSNLKFLTRLQGCPIIEVTAYAGIFFVLAAGRQ